MGLGAARGGQRRLRGRGTETARDPGAHILLEFVGFLAAGVCQQLRHRSSSLLQILFLREICHPDQAPCSLSIRLPRRSLLSNVLLNALACSSLLLSGTQPSALERPPCAAARSY